MHIENAQKIHQQTKYGVGKGGEDFHFKYD